MGPDDESDAEPRAGLAAGSLRVLAPGARSGVAELGPDVRDGPGQSRSARAMEAVPRSVDRGLVSRAGTGHEHGELCAADGQVPRPAPVGAGAAQEGDGAIRRCRAPDPESRVAESAH